MKKFFLAIVLIATACTGLAQEKKAIIRSSIQFQVKNMGINTEGSIGGLQADVQFSPATLATAAITATVDANTVNTDNSSRDEHLKSEDFFDVAHYPKITLKSVSFKHKSGNNYSGQFNLTIRAKTKLVEIPFSYSDKGSTAAIQGVFKINRLDFGIGGDSMILSNEVTVTITAEVEK